jgi:8-oxo-(d)GTP phosphatase
VVRSAGAVPWRPGPGEPEVALVYRQRYDDWTFPKGKQEAGEHLLLTAVREVGEESGLRVALGRPLPAQEYPVGGKVKKVSYWAGRCTEATPFVPSREVGQMRWHPASDAAAVLSYPRDASLLAEFLAGPADTVPVILLRHAEAGSKQDRVSGRNGPAASAADRSRPLDDEGAAQAEALAALLACYGRGQVVSSPAERCLGTVRPYAAAVGVPVLAEEALVVEPGADQQAAMARARRAARLAADLVQAGEPAIVCAHRENMPVVIGAVFGAVGAEPPAEPLAKAEFLVAHLAGRKLAGVERHCPGW